MTADIVERLRESAKNWCDDTDDNRAQSRMELDAAEEIERLRAALAAAGPGDRDVEGMRSALEAHHEWALEHGPSYINSALYLRTRAALSSHPAKPTQED
jgi:hypothetical protein